MTLRPRTVPACNLQTGNSVCFECREAERGIYQTCPSCKKDMTYIGFWNEVPKKHSKNRWKQLERRIKKIIPLSIENDTIPMTIGHRGIVKPKYNRAKENDNANFDEL